MLMGEITAGADAHGLTQLFAGLSRSLVVCDLGVTGLALAASLAATVNLVLLGGMLYRRLGRFPWLAWSSSLLWSLTASLAMAVLVRWIAQQINWLDPEVPFVLRLGVLVLAVAAGTASFLLLVWKGGREELRALTAMLPELLLRLLPPFLQPRR